MPAPVPVPVPVTSAVPVPVPKHDDDIMMTAASCTELEHRDRVLMSTSGGLIVLPELVLVSRGDGGHLIVEPPRAVWERSELSAEELSSWGALVAATGWAMLESLAPLRDGCINYWEAGNWALHDEAEPRGPKHPRMHRRVHQHLLGRSPQAAHQSWIWGEAPVFPPFKDRRVWAAAFEPLTAHDCQTIVGNVSRRLRSAFGWTPERIGGVTICASCGYPRAA